MSMLRNVSAFTIQKLSNSLDREMGSSQTHINVPLATYGVPGLPRLFIALMPLSLVVESFAK